MLNTLSVSTFEPLVGQSFRARFDGTSITEIALVEVSPMESDADARRARSPFRLMFRGPAGRVAPQAIYTVENDVLGEMGIFLVPIKADAHGVEYEAIFT
jgi:hypothetical protein